MLYSIVKFAMELVALHPFQPGSNGLAYERNNKGAACQSFLACGSLPVGVPLGLRFVLDPAARADKVAWEYRPNTGRSFSRRHSELCRSMLMSLNPAMF